MSQLSQKNKAEMFRRLHHGPKLLLLINAWDVASARILEAAGVSAIATTSAGIAVSLGYPDGQKISRREMLGVVARMARVVDLPLTADVEAGYGFSPDDAAETAREVIASGAVGMNFEDSTGDPARPLIDLSLQLERIAAIREAASAAGVPLVLNARTDPYLLSSFDGDRYTETKRRLSAYRDAGADCVFAPGLSETDVIAKLVSELKCPLNILAGPGSPTLAELQQAGVARVSLGSAAMRATLGLLQRITKELASAGTYESLADAPSHSEVNRLMK
jgi:2-methylisocitrate lyase-like PEP mutase family enzyme